MPAHGTVPEQKKNKKGGGQAQHAYLRQIKGKKIFIY